MSAVLILAGKRLARNIKETFWRHARIPSELLMIRDGATMTSKNAIVRASLPRLSTGFSPSQGTRPQS
jgi:hypothetical protein